MTFTMLSRLHEHFQERIFQNLSFLLIATALSVLFMIPTSFAANGDIIITVQDELGGAVTGATYTFECTGGGGGLAVTDGDGNDGDGISNGTISIAAATAGGVDAHCETNAEAFTTETIAKDGYVTASTSLTSYATGAENTETTAIAFSHKIVVKNELNASLTPDSATAGASSTACTVSTNNVYCAVPLADDNTVSNGFSVVKDGYVTASVDLGGNRTAASDAQQVVTMDASNGLDFAYKLTSLTSEASTDLTASVTTLTVGDATGQNSCSSSGGAWYCPVVLANSNEEPTGTATLDGYVAEAIDLTGSSTRSSGATAQVSDTLTSIKFAHKVTIVDELGSNLTGATVTAGTGDTSCTISSNVAYCPVTLATDDASTTPDEFTIVLDGYVTGTVSLGGDRTANSDAQQAVTMTSSNGLDFSHKVYVQQNTDSTALSGATVSVGGTSCTDNGNGYYYCATLLANDGGSADVIVSKSSYKTNTTSSTDRTAGTDAQGYYIIGLEYTEGGSSYSPTSSGGSSSSSSSSSSSEEEETSTEEESVSEEESDSETSSEDSSEEEESNESEEEMAGDFEDTAGHWAIEYIEELFDMGGVSGTSDTTFEPDANLTRGEVVEIAMLSFGYSIQEGVLPSFDDVEEGSEYASVIATAEENGIVSGYEDGSFQADAYISRAEALKVFVLAAGLSAKADNAPFEDVDQDSWYAEYVNYAYAMGVVNGKSENSFAPGDVVTRAEATKMAVLLYHLME